MTARVELTRTSGVFQLDGGTFEVDNNVWIIGDDHEVLIVDPSHEPDRILAAIGGRRVTAVVCTHGHNDHINAAVPVADAVGAPILLHVDDEVLWKQVYPDRAPDRPLADGDRLPVAALEFTVLHTPGHTWGGICLHEAEQGWLFSGDTLFRGGPGATGRSFSDFPTIVHAISERLLGLDPATIVHTGHGETTTIGAEAPHRDEWLIRGR